MQLCVSCHCLETLEAQRKPISIGPILNAAWQVDGPAV